MTATASSQKRQINLDALRILSMLMIICLHFFSHGGVLEKLVPFSADYYFAWICEGLALVSVNCFVLFSGYFLVDSTFKPKKLFMLLAEVFFYSVVLYIIFAAAGMIPISKSEILGVLTPFLSCRYWFFTMYVGMYILSPFLNIFIKAVSKKQFFSLIVCLIGLFSLWPNIFFNSRALNFGGENGVVWFIVLYFIGAYLKKYYVPANKIKKPLLIYLCFAIALPLSRFAVALLSKTAFSSIISAETLLAISGIFYSYNSVLVLAGSLALFVLFLNIEIKGRLLCKLVGFFAPLTFGVYLIHDNGGFKLLLWRLVNAPAQMGKLTFPLYLAACVAAIFLFCALVDAAREQLFKAVSRLSLFRKTSEKLRDGFVRFIDKYGA